MQPMWENSSWNRMERSKGKPRERSLSFIGREGDRADHRDEAVVIVDPFSTFSHLAKQCFDAGFKVSEIMFR